MAKSVLVPVSSTTLPTIREEVPRGQCQVFLDVRPEGITLLAQVRFTPRTTPGSSELLADENLSEHLPESARQLLDGVLGRVDAFLERFQDQMEAVAAPSGLELWEENRRLRMALQECVETCEPLLNSPEEFHREGAEGEYAEAWLAIDSARELLGKVGAGEAGAFPALGSK